MARGNQVGGPFGLGSSQCQIRRYDGVWELPRGTPCAGVVKQLSGIAPARINKQWPVELICAWNHVAPTSDLLDIVELHPFQRVDPLNQPLPAG